jgi:hypothetical protein
VQRRGTEGYDSFDLVIANTVGGLQVEVNTVLDLLALRDFDEEEPRLPAGPHDHALLVSGLIRIAGHVGEPEHVPPERRGREGVATIERRMRDPRDHAPMVASEDKRFSFRMIRTPWSRVGWGPCFASTPRAAQRRSDGLDRQSLTAASP